LCKRNGIKASGKNADIVEKLKAHALNHVLDSSHLTYQPFSSDDDDEKENRRIVRARPSDQWTVIAEDSREVKQVHLGLKDIRVEVDHEMSPKKSYGIPGGPIEFGAGTTGSKGGSHNGSLPILCPADRVSRKHEFNPQVLRQHPQTRWFQILSCAYP